MRISSHNVSMTTASAAVLAILAVLVLLALPVQVASAAASDADASAAASDADADAGRMARMEQRLLELEQRLAETEQTTQEVKTLASNTAASTGSGGKNGKNGESHNNSAILDNAATFDILAGSAWRNLRWTQEEQWAGIKRGVSEERVIELLGYPPRSIDSLKPRVDKAYYYEASIRDRSTGMRGKVSFRKGKVISFKKPDFSKKRSSPEKVSEATSRQRLP